MKAFVAAVVAAVLIAVVAALSLDQLEQSTAELRQSPPGSVRLD